MEAARVAHEKSLLNAKWEQEQKRMADEKEALRLEAQAKLRLAAEEHQLKLQREAAALSVVDARSAIIWSTASCSAWTRVPSTRPT